MWLDLVSLRGYSELLEGKTGRLNASEMNYRYFKMSINELFRDEEPC
jgi:hypothetical protein